MRLLQFRSLLTTTNQIDTILEFNNQFDTNFAFLILEGSIEL